MDSVDATHIATTATSVATATDADRDPLSGPTTPTELTVTTASHTFPTLSLSLSSLVSSTTGAVVTSSLSPDPPHPPRLQTLRRWTDSASAVALTSSPTTSRPSSPSPLPIHFLTPARSRRGSSTPTTPTATGSSIQAPTTALQRTRSSLASLTSMGAGRLHRIRDKIFGKKYTDTSSGGDQGDAPESSSDSGSGPRSRSGSGSSATNVSSPIGGATETPSLISTRSGDHRPAHRQDLEYHRFHASCEAEEDTLGQRQQQLVNHPISVGEEDPEEFASPDSNTTATPVARPPPSLSPMATTTSPVDSTANPLVSIAENEVFDIPEDPETPSTAADSYFEDTIGAAAMEPSLPLDPTTADISAGLAAASAPTFDLDNRSPDAPSYSQIDDQDSSGQSTPKPTTAAGSAVLPNTLHGVKTMTRKIWVRRPGASATMVIIHEDDLVDDMRDCILRKYANSLGKFYDSPDIGLRICARDSQEPMGSRGRLHQYQDRDLGPEEPIGAVLDTYFPDGQLVDDAVLIDIPHAHTRTTPGPSPALVSTSHAVQPAILYTSTADDRPSETGETYFPHVVTGSIIAPVHYPHTYPHPQHAHQQPPLHQQHPNQQHSNQQHPHQQHPHLQHPHLQHPHHQTQPHVHPYHHAQMHLPRAITPNTGLSQSMPGLLGTAQPPLPSPGGSGGGGGSLRSSRTYRDRPERPRLGRTHTSSPGIMGLTSVAVGGSSVLPNTASNISGHPSIVGGRQHEFGVMSGITNIGASIPSGGIGPDEDVKQVLRVLPGGTAPDDGRPLIITGSPPPGSSPPLMINSRLLSKKPKKQMVLDSLSPPPPGAVNNGVPPINVLIVEDNPINLKLLEAFVKRLKVRWKTAMNGRDAVAKWRGGGFHLVLMDIQLPVMNGLEATREIRRLERVNSIGIFTSSSSSPFNIQQQQLLLLPGQVSEDDKPVEQDKLKNPEMFKSPVIIVALTASSLQSDRHEALAAGCNDFLTKPVNFDWLERKVMEWGCMQALIDFDGWRKWKAFTSDVAGGEGGNGKQVAGVKPRSKKNRS